MKALGLGIGWRPELSQLIARRPDLGFVELMADSLNPNALPRAVHELRERGVKIVLHSIGLSLGGAEPLQMWRVDRLARMAEATGAELVSDHVCFVRAGAVESGHLLPVPFNDVALDVLTENIAAAKRVLPVPLALENIASFVSFGGGTMDEPQFLSRLLDRTRTSLLLDVANLHANALNHSFDPIAWLDAMPLDRVAYVHLAGGTTRGGLYHDTHCHPLPAGPLDLLCHVAKKGQLGGALLERDDHFHAHTALNEELDAIGRCL